MILPLVLRALTWVAIVAALLNLTSIFYVARVNWLLFSFSTLLLAAALGLQKFEHRGYTSETVNLLVGACILYATIASPTDSLASIINSVAIIGAAFLLTPEAGLIWGAVAILALLARALIVGLPSLLTIPPVVAQTTVTGLSWLLSRSFHSTYLALRRQIEQTRTGVEIGRMVTSALDLSAVTAQAVRVICSAFGYYHVGLYALDPEGKLAILLDAAGEAAAHLKETGFRVSLEGPTAVATAIKRGQRLTVASWRESRGPGGQPIQFTYSRLPTRVELVIPLAARGQVLGALDLHSIDINAFPEEEVNILEGVAGNIANALQNARLFDDIQRRHQELGELYAQTERRARYLEATAQLARAISSLLDPQELLDRAVHLISEGLGVYHVGIFLLDAAGEWAVLAAANSEGGKRMLARGHRLRVGEQGFVGRATGTGQPYIGLDVGADAVHFANPDLPDTRSEVALPLKIGDRVIGALDVQSVQEAAFSEEDVAELQILADQIAVAIENARLFQQTQEALEEMRTLQRYYVAREWKRVTRRREQLVSAEYRGLGIPPLGSAPSPEMELVLQQEAPLAIPDLSSIVKGNGGNGRHELMARAALAVPIKLHDEIIGILDLQETENRTWSEDDIAVATAVADQLALALENARLFEEAQRRAAQLAAAQEVARDATAILDIDQLLNETVQLISEQFGFYHAGVFLLDDKREYAVLRAASSEGGRRMLARGHKLPVGRVGIVGYVAGTGEPRIALDVGKDAVHFANPDLPNTRSEMGLPLKVRGQVIGVLDVQSTEEAAFSDEDISVLQTLADQLAAAIANARLFQEVRTDAMRRALLNEVQQAAATSLDPEQLLHRAGEVISVRMARPSIFFLWEADRRALRPVAIHNENGEDILFAENIRLTREVNPSLFYKVIDGKRTSILNTQATYVGPVGAAMAEQAEIHYAVYVPLIGREQILGLLAVAQPTQDVPQDELEFIELIGANLSVALESAFLYQNALETAEKLKEMDRLKSQFLANMSHELRTPLNSIIGFSRVILKGIDGPLTEMQRTDLEAVYNSGQHLLSLINNILDISKIQAGKMEINIVDTDLRDIIKSVMSTAVGLVKDKPIELQQVVPENLPIIRADAGRIRQVLLNIVGNAAKFTERGFIRLEAEATPTEVIIKVSDSGIGIPQDKLTTIFEEFTQVDGSSTRAVGGTGLGLAISRNFVEMHGGRIWAESTVGKGSTFYVALPIAGPSEAPKEEEEDIVTVEQPIPGAKTILCVDDDEGVITLFRRYLSKKGYQVIGLTRSTNVVERTLRIRPFAITLDVMMPEKDGWQVIQELKTNPHTRDIPVIICSIVSDKEYGLSLGASDYLVKPVLEEDLIAALERLDKRKEGQQQVLIVDDHAPDRKLLRRMIETNDRYRVIEASGGREAIELIQRIRPDIIILDLMMPEVDGFAVLETIKANRATRSIPIIVVTAKDLTPEERDILNRGVAALLQKGLFGKQELLADVAAALERIAVAENNQQRT
ncbi:MAG: GAF domain-containing protein [Anaerolineae bacterium]|nr:GAF domain-containing protein [Anaerolineae bacterium]